MGVRDVANPFAELYFTKGENGTDQELLYIFEKLTALPRRLYGLGNDRVPRTNLTDELNPHTKGD